MLSFKTILHKVTSTNPFSFPLSPSYAPYNFSLERHIASAHMEKLDYFLGSLNQPTPYLSLANPLHTKKFTGITSRNVFETTKVTCQSRDLPYRDYKTETNVMLRKREICLCTESRKPISLELCSLQATNTYFLCQKVSHKTNMDFLLTKT